MTPTLPSFAYVADVVSPSSRTIGFALNSVTVAMAFVIAQLLVGSGVVPGVAIVSYLCVGLAVFSLIGCLFFIPESLSREVMESSRVSLQDSTNVLETRTPKFVVSAVTTFWGSFSILFRNALFRKLTLCMLILNLNKVHDMEAQYFQEVAQFGTKDLAKLFALVGLAGLAVTTVGIWTMVSLLRMTDKSILIVGFLALAMQRLLFMFLRQKLGIYLASVLGAVANLILPAINSIKSRNVGLGEQGALQGAIVSIQSVAKGIAPFLFLLFFKLFRRKSLYFPGAPFLVGFLLLVGGNVLTFTIKIRTYRQDPIYSEGGEPFLDSQCVLRTHSIALSSDSVEDS